MKTILLTIAILASCAQAAQADKPSMVPTWAAQQMNYFCLPQGDGGWAVYLGASADCKDPQPVFWESIPIKVAFVEEVGAETLMAMALINEEVGFELLVAAANEDYAIVITPADFAVPKGILALTSHVTQNKEHKVLISFHGGSENLHSVGLVKHELGHALGLSHSAHNSASAMYPKPKLSGEALLEYASVRILRALYEPRKKAGK